MQAGGMGRTQNTRRLQTVRGQIADRMRHVLPKASPWPPCSHASTAYV
jgi:hypothetical protein